MNALEFIDQLVADDRLQDYDAKTAHNQFIELGGDGSYDYFRTKFNNKYLDIFGEKPKRISTTQSNQKINIPKIIPSEHVEEMVQEALITLETKSYSNGEELPELPRLIPTGTFFDQIISDRVTTDEEKEDYKEKWGKEMPDEMIEVGGFTRKCADVVAGDPGAGKTYTRCILAAKAKVFAKRELGKELKVGFISGEMREAEWSKELHQCELMRLIDVNYMLDYVGVPNYEDLFWEAVAKYDITIVDSLPAIISHIKMNPHEKRTEKVIIFDFIRKMLKSVEINDNNVQIINQANKDGNYKGGTELPHMMSSMSFVKIEGQNRYMIYTKNRNNGNVKRKLFFSKMECGDLEFNEEAFNATYNQILDKKETLSEFLGNMKESESEQKKLQELGENSSNIEMGVEEMEQAMHGEPSKVEDTTDEDEKDLAERDLEDEDWEEENANAAEGRAAREDDLVLENHDQFEDLDPDDFA